MSQRSMILSAFVTAFVLVVIGGVVANMTDPRSAELATAEPSSTDPAAGPDATAEDDPVLAQREAEYRRLIDEANRRLTEQQRALEVARRRVRAAEAQSAQVAQAAADPRFSRGEDERYEHDDDDDDDDHHHGHDDDHDEEDEEWEDD